MMENLQTEWASLLLTSLAHAGVRDVVISPGSRSTPYVAAAVREPRMTRHSVIDERAAAFFALGQARITGRPSLLVCTSGTAAAHYLPAIIEADITGIPMLVLTADRPHELYDCRAPQTIDQVKVFGSHARKFFDLVPEPADQALRAIRRIAAQATLASRWPQPGVVHLNARARKPLEPRPARTAEERDLSVRARAIASVPLTSVEPPRLLPSQESVAAAATLIRSARRGLIVAGPAGLSARDCREALWELSEATGFPLAPDTTSQLRFAPRPAGSRLLDGLEVLLGSSKFRSTMKFDLAIQIGAPPTSGAWEQVASSIPRVVLSEHGWSDPHSTAAAMIFGQIASSASALVGALKREPPAPDREFHDRLSTLNEQTWKAIDEAFEAEAPFDEGAAVRALVEQLPERSTFVIGNSLAVRLVESAARATTRDIDVLSQRGAAGIDGLVAGAAGAAVASGKPLALLLGDVSLLHDLTSLKLAAEVATPFVIVVVHNGGGRIFDLLPLAERDDLDPAVLTHATTPHDTDFSHAARLFGVRFARARDSDEARAALAEAWAHAGCTLIEVRIGAGKAVASRARVRSIVDRVMDR